MYENVTVLGAGVFGTAIATLLSNNGHKVKLWCYEKQVAQDIESHRENKIYLSGVKLDSNITATDNLEEAIADNKWVFQAIPVKFLRSILQNVKNFVSDNQIIVSLSKGIEQESFLLPTDIIKDVLGSKIKTAVMCGPNFAKEIVQKYYTATTIAADDKSVAKDLALILSSSYFKTYLSDDIVGVQVGGAIKNVITLAVGMVNGSQNTIAFVLTRGLIEMARLAKHFGGKSQTIYGLSGFGDLVLSSTGTFSRNLMAGKLLGERKSLDKVKVELRVLPEGINTVQSIHQLIKKSDLQMPICVAVYKTIFEQGCFGDFLEDFMVQPLEVEDNEHCF
ncbi:NAD(P)-dependent glycerol-3-phosphate dehydrogenase [Candidatus Babeliales bacterium]|nr:NAD(P)-dependent glycerol-3-phosphate dehydrogenase [Candidatus Babeliales bacterium]